MSIKIIVPKDFQYKQRLKIFFLRGVNHLNFVESGLEKIPFFNYDMWNCGREIV